MKKMLIISARSYGDAIIHAYYANILGEKFDVTIFTKEEFREIYMVNPKYNIIYSKFPMGTNSTIALFQLLLQIIKLRKYNFDYAIDFMGDFRERLILSMIKPRHLMSVEREPGHPFNHLIRKGLSFLVEPILLSREMINIYDQLDFVVEKLVEGKKKRNKKISQSKIIGIHPFASQKCRMWTWKKWNLLIDKLCKLGYEIIVFGSPQQRVIIENNFVPNDRIHVVCGTLNNFFDNLEKCKCIICLDSFAYHAAYYKNIPSVMLNGGNQYKIWINPLSVVIHNEKECVHWPCYNNPKCDDYCCITSIEVQDVIHNIKILERNANFIEIS